MLLLPLVIILVWSASLLVVAGLCVAACRGDATLAEHVHPETGPTLQPVQPPPAIEAREGPARIAA
jgi:hypothetical protein